jgi:hypothetical protein
LVIGGLKGSEQADPDLNWAWNAEDRDKVTYAAHGIPAAGA